MKTVTIKNGNLYLDSDLYETYFCSINSVVLLERDSLFLLMPVQQGGGGLLLKILNARGDRIVHSLDFFQQHGIDSMEEKVLDAEWNAEFGALTFSAAAITAPSG